MTKKFYNWMTIVMLTLASSFALTSCSDDDSEATIVGTWELTEVYEDEWEVETINMVLTFNKNNTGKIVESWSTESKSSSNALYSMSFSWAITTNSNGNQILNISYVDGDKDTELFPGSSSTSLWTRQYVLTGKILNIYSSSGNSVWVFKKK